MEPIIISASFFQEQLYLGVLGRTGEHEARRISFDCSEVLKTWPEATILCVCRRPCDTAAYPIPLTADGTTYTMPLMSRETAAAGTIKLELRAVRDDTVLKSAIFYGRILPSLNGQKDAPGNPLSDALNRLESTIANAQTLADEIRQKLDNGEFVGERGPKGDKGDKGEPGADGSDATVTAENIQSALGYAPVRDVQIAGSSVLVDGVANAPIASETNYGVVKVFDWGGTWIDQNKRLCVLQSSIGHIARRESRTVIVPENLDNAVKAAMCDGKGAAWTDAEQKAARERMGVDKQYELIEEIALTESSTVMRTNEPDGTPYKFDKLKYCVIVPAAAADPGLYVNAVIYSDTGIYAISYTALSSDVDNVVVGEMKKEGATWECHQPASGRTGPQAMYKTAQKYLSIPNAYGEYIAKFFINVALPTDTKIYIYGVRV